MGDFLRANLWVVSAWPATPPDVQRPPMFVVNSISARTMSWGKTFSSTLSHVHIQNVSCTRRMKKALLFLVERLAYILSSHLPLELYREMHFHSIHTLMALEILLSYSVFLCVTLIRGWFGAKISSHSWVACPQGCLGTSQSEFSFERYQCVIHTACQTLKVVDRLRCTIAFFTWKEGSVANVSLGEKVNIFSSAKPLTSVKSWVFKTQSGKSGLS